jgi:PBP1b-binding outer membrane lipoprotein LpoB
MKRTSRSIALISGVLLALGAAVPGCATPNPSTTRLTSTDLVTMTDEMTSSLLRDEVIGQRTPDSERWVISIDRVRNLTEHPMTMQERWATMARLRARMAQTDFARQRNIAWILPPDLWQQYGADTYNPRAQRQLPSHSLHATFYSDTVTSLAGRSDAYLCLFTLTDLASGQIVWEDRFEVKYSQRSSAFN